MLNKDKLIYLGYIGKAHGIRGCVCVKSLTSIPDDIVKMPLQDESGRDFRLRLISHKPEFLVCMVEGITDRNAAELLKGTKLYTLRSSMPTPEEKEYYIEDIVGLEVKDSLYNKLGEVLAMHNYGAGDIIEIKFNDSVVEMHPFTEAYFPIINDEYIIFAGDRYDLKSN